MTEYLCSSRSQTTQNQNISLDDLRRYLGIEDCKAYFSFFALNAKVIQPAIKEINNKSDLIIQCNFNKQGTRVVSLSFDVKRKESFINTNSNWEDIKDTVETNPLNFQMEGESLGLSQTLLTKHVSMYGEERVQKAINFVQQAVREGKKIKSIPAYYSSCLQNNWETSLPYSLIEKLPEPDFMELVGKNEVHVNALNTLFNKIGGNSYKSWFQEVEFQRVEKHKLCVQTSSKFTADYINAHFSSAILEAWRESGEEIQQLEIFKS